MTAAGTFFGIVEPSGRPDRWSPTLPPLQRFQQFRGDRWTLTWWAVGNHPSLYLSGLSGAAFLGEVYDPAALCRSLALPADSPPSQVLLAARARWSEHLFDRVDGIGVLACWIDGRLELHREGSGARSLYYARLPGGGLAFATDLGVMFELPGVRRRLSRPSLHEYLRFLDIAAPNTPYEDLYALEAGQRLCWSDGQIRIEPIPRGHSAAPSPRNIGEAVDSLERLLRDSIARRLDGLENPAAFLSGGVDSSLVCALARHVSPRTTAVTVGFEGARYDETPMASAVANHLQMAHEVLRFDRQQCIRAVETLGRRAEQPFSDPAGPPTLLAFERCGERYDAVLDGTGADESVGAMPPRHVRLAVQYADRLPRYVRGLVVGLMGRLPGLRSYTPIFDFGHPAELMIRWQGFTRQEIEALCDEPVSFEHTHFFRTFARFPRRAHFERYSALEDAMPNDRLHQAARITGVSLRFPYFESHVDQFVRSLPIGFRYQPSAPKRILRELLARHVPRAIWDVPKHGFDFPLREFLHGEDFALVRRYLDEGHWLQWELMAPARVADYGRRYIAGEEQLMFRVWTLIVLAAWLEGHDAAA